MSEQAPDFSFTVLTINTHKGFSPFNRRFILPELREAVRSVSADVVFLQEVQGRHETHPLHVESWPDTPHYEFLAETMWNDYAYGRNAVYPEGDHGNAVLSRFPIFSYRNLDISLSEHERRGLLYCVLKVPNRDLHLHVVCVHLGMSPHRQRQQMELLHTLLDTIPPDVPLVVAGDFNDWLQQATPDLNRYARLEEVFSQHYGKPARTFPARFPLLRLDRIYVRNVRTSAPTLLGPKPWSHLSDHAPLAVEIHV
ncbi:endonuclease/exonuclease/phosphatase family protein [Musicola paradisiaca]|uniref:Endonuclease/exonuclease/phosphatase n=1 Tax=Musicola paradisiaca (strain Ech703) TaxID=579405 RepID=C6C906_MUSP7|nr:endonuclease/exonuclease/phosphatase family protein [Musicola paradisiaca]ACS86206.1 Endonuclease/exonuclease/phosphatase [Musicola paradisiaca Ech703]